MSPGLWISKVPNESSFAPKHTGSTFTFCHPTERNRGRLSCKNSDSDSCLMFTHTHKHVGTQKKGRYGISTQLVDDCSPKRSSILQYEKQSKDHAHSYMYKWLVWESGDTQLSRLREKCIKHICLNVVRVRGTQRLSWVSGNMCLGESNCSKNFGSTLPNK